MDFGEIYNTAWGIMGVVGGVGAIVVMLWVSARSTHERDAEDHARDFYAEHGHWPDEDAIPPTPPPDPLPPVR